MSGMWLTYSNRKDKEILKLTENLERTNAFPGLSYSDLIEKATEQLNKFEEDRWTRAIMCEIRYDKLREKLREEHGLGKPINDKIKGYSFITLNPPPEVEMEDFLDLTNRVASEFSEDKETFECTFEQRGEKIDDIGKGKHCHMIIKNSKYPSGGYKQKMLQDINKIVKAFATEKGYKKLKCESIDYKPIPTAEILEQKQNYIRGFKKSEKMEKVFYDKPFRDKYNLPETLDYHSLEEVVASITNRVQCDDKRPYKSNGALIKNGGTLTFD